MFYKAYYELEDLEKDCKELGIQVSQVNKVTIHPDVHGRVIHCDNFEARILNIEPKGRRIEYLFELETDRWVMKHYDESFAYMKETYEKTLEKHNKLMSLCDGLLLKHVGFNNATHVSGDLVFSFCIDPIGGLRVSCDGLHLTTLDFNLRKAIDELKEKIQDPSTTHKLLYKR